MLHVMSFILIKLLQPGIDEERYFSIIVVPSENLQSLPQMELFLFMLGCEGWRIDHRRFVLTSVVNSWFDFVTHLLLVILEV